MSLLPRAGPVNPAYSTGASSQSPLSQLQTGSAPTAPFAGSGSNCSCCRRSAPGGVGLHHRPSLCRLSQQ
eukprot:jgi/Tetstr1/438100/TSEL_026723.t1